jgi:hypothetical protein
MTDLVKAKNTSGRVLHLSTGIVKPDDTIEIPYPESVALGAYLTVEGASPAPSAAAKKPAKDKAEVLNPEDL